MPKKAEELSALQVRRLSDPGRHSVGGVDGLILNVTPSGTRSWVLRVQTKASRRDIGLGGYPSVTLEAARKKARELRELVEAGLDPLAERQREIEANRLASFGALTYEKVACECHDSLAPSFRNPKHAAQWISTQETYVFPLIGQLAVNSITVAEVIKVLKPIWYEKPETASRVRGRIQKVLSYAKVAGYRQGENPALWSDNLQLLLPSIRKLRPVKHHPAMPLEEVPGLVKSLRAIDSVGARALEFLILTASRSGEVRLARPVEIDLKAGLWCIPGERMKGRRDHRVPLSPRALEIVKSMDFRSTYLFPGRRTGSAMSLDTLTKIMEDLKLPYVPHGFRSTFKDWARTHGKQFQDEVSELALAHVNNDATRAAYARDELLDLRREMLTLWAAFCEPVVQEQKVTALKARRR
jgi:integrase